MGTLLFSECEINFVNGVSSEIGLFCVCNVDSLCLSLAWNGYRQAESVSGKKTLFDLNSPFFWSRLNMQSILLMCGNRCFQKIMIC